MRHLLCTAALMLTIVATASAHAVGISKGEYRVDGAKVDATLVFARQELLDAVTGLDANRDGALSESELWHARAGIEATIVQGLEIRAAASPCVRALGDLALTEQDGVAVHIGFQCMGHARSITIAVDFIAALSHGHRHLATIGTAATVLYRGHSTFAAAIDAASHARHGVGPLFWLGIEHILTGYDHLVFLLGLMLVGGRLRSLLVVITAFTLAHSITLGAAAFRLWTPSAAIIEPAIALSIAYVGIENWFVTDAARRWMITFPFGLVHGFGFAGALEDVGLSADQIPMALAAFNAGVEVGQLAVVGVALPAILWVRSRHRLGLAVVRVASVAITVAGVWWFTVRVI